MTELGTFRLFFGCSSSLLVGAVNNESKIATNDVKTKYIFTMQKESFNKFLPYFSLKNSSRLVMRETFFSLDLMENNIWIKEVIEFDDRFSEKKKYYDIKRVESVSEQVNGFPELKYTM